MKPATKQAFQLLHDGAVALAQATRNGIRLDVEYIRKAKEDVDERVRLLEEEALADEVGRAWRKQYGPELNLASREQLASVLSRQGVKLPRTAKGRLRTDKKAFDDVDIPFVKFYKRIAEWKKLDSTYLDGFKREAQYDGTYWLVHPFFNLHTVKTYRSSSDSPNFQNITGRDKELAKIIRSAFIARDGYQLGEFDFKAAEVCVSACYNKDPQLIKYVSDPVTNDMHRDMACQIYKLRPDQVTKGIRNIVKAAFVFAEFYGDYYVHAAKSLWDAVDREKLALADGMPLRQHLAAQNFTKLGACKEGQRPLPGTFEAFIKSVEEHFWNIRFPGYTAWKNSWHEQYKRDGGFNTLTGFKVEGILTRNQCLNYAIQGSAFHCLLWVLVRLQRWLNKNGMKSLIIGQIHDSIIMDIYCPELPRILKKVKQLVTVKLAEYWDWIIVPMVCEAEIAPPGGSWWDKKGVAL